MKPPAVPAVFFIGRLRRGSTKWHWLKPGKSLTVAAPERLKGTRRAVLRSWCGKAVAPATEWHTPDLFKMERDLWKVPGCRECVLAMMKDGGYSRADALKSFSLSDEEQALRKRISEACQERNKAEQELQRVLAEREALKATAKARLEARKK